MKNKGTIIRQLISLFGAHSHCSGKMQVELSTDEVEKQGKI